MAEFRSVDDFLNYKGSDGGGGAKRLKSWTKKGFLNFWFHTKQFPCSVWYHAFPELVVRTQKDNPGVTLKNVWNRSFACWEDESILKKQRFRAADGSREHPPKKCGDCRLVEATREMVRLGHMKDTDVIFKFDGSDKPEENKGLHAGGVAALWKRDDLDEATKARLAQHGIYMGNAPGRPGAWAESLVAKLNYIFVGVDQDDVPSGIQTAVQSQLVGDRVKREINNQMASNTGDLGNPFLNPYCLQLVYKPEEKKFDEKYDARRMNRFELTPQIEALIKGEKPDIRKYTEKFNQASMRATMEEHATEIGKRLPWDSIFDVPPPGNPDAAPPVAVPPVRTQVQVPAASAPSAPLPNMIPCDDCKTLMRDDEIKCQKCGAEYANDDAQAPPKAAATAPAAPANPAPEFSQPEGVYEEGEVPF